jgi:lincosamide nucleotidyltransferase A/C/D/E
LHSCAIIRATESIYMIAADIVCLYTELQDSGITIWIDGGWGVDALLGEQTRHHGDLDIAILQKDVPKPVDLLGRRGYKEVKRDSEWNFVLGDDHGHKLDLHVFTLDAQGNVEKGIMYPPGSLTGTGRIEGHPVRCISADWMVKFHCGYQVNEKDFRDVSALCEKFGLDLPEEYVQFKRST